ncbi:putative filament-forming protein [Phaeoacremonium minimum UCRPA7]|uniref:Putative filament-forming protein n=1 Tax=Phaeoacremonium minimum (strain UCR-PA7) TaxID=1286976 RepID=R8BWP7_PHAM7|nr:putative filament-forming protein [Phaeoacremonium minimum UCRPA7]EOO03724.1 putative filament-forming protein [Phaeoacremonium minimum UCRPA7]
MAAATVDLGYLSTHLGVPETTLTTVTTDPTAELVNSVLEAVVAKAREYDTLYSEKLQVDIELENAVRSAEARCQSFKATADKALKDVEEIRQKLQDEESSRQALQNQLESLKSSTTTSQSQLDTLRARITSLETSNRETLAIVESKTTANAELSEELQKQHQKNLKLGQEISSLQQSVQAAQAAANSAKWREQNIQQELALARKNNEWFENELKTKSEEALKLRKEKGARIAELQRINDEASSNIESLTRTEQQLRSRLDEAQKKADEALSKVQQLQEAAARSEDAFRQELESSRRLVELKEQQTETHRNRLREVEQRLEQVKDDCENTVRNANHNLEQEKMHHSEALERIQTLEHDLENARVNQAVSNSRPQTPQPNGSVFGRMASPSGTPASIRGKASTMATQTLTELIKAQAELREEKRKNETLNNEIEEILSALEAKGPELDELQAEAERLRRENIQMTQLADESYQERDLAKKAAKKAEAAANTAQAEIKILRAQLRDLSSQIQLLVFNMHAQEKGLDQLSEEEALHFARLQRGEVAENALDDMSDTHQFITEKFVAFKDVYELQSKNQELLRVTRELADQMENEEALAAKQQAAKDQQEVIHLRETVSRLQDEVRSMTTRMKSHMQERDMFRRLLQQKASAAEVISAADGQEYAGGHREVLASIEQTSQTDESTLHTALRELQNNFDSYRNEQAADHKTMREHVDKLSAEKSSLQSEIAKIRSQLDLAAERYSMLQSNYTALQNENKELQKRNQSFSETAAKQDIRTQQLAADLIEARALVDSMTSKKANLEAEKELWNSIRERLSQDNENLSQEKARLNTLLTQHQTLLNERELHESETRRRLQGQIDSLETELKTTKRKLAEEVEESKKVQLRKEFDAQQNQSRIDDLVTQINKLKQDLTAAQTSKDHLQARVDELTVEVRNAHERAERLQPRPTPRPGTGGPAQVDEETEAQIQELINEVSDVKRDLDLATTHLESAKAQVEQYKDLAKAMEEELTSVNATQDEYREEVDAALAAKDTRIKELEQRVEDLSAELANTNNELSSIRDSQAEFTRKFEDEKHILDAEIARLKDEEDRYKETAKYHHQDLRAQAEIATKAQQDYEQELVKHAEAAKALQSLRSEFNQLKSESAALKAEAESAKHTLAENERSWTDREEQLHQEIGELRERRKDADRQNKLLQEQLDSVSSQISAIQQSRAALADEPEAGNSSVVGGEAERLRELNAYLSREKEILEVQYDLKVQEAKRLQQQLEIKHSQLEEAQLKLQQERAARADTRTSISHQDLMNKLNELNLIRESNVTLRNENQRMQAQLAEKSAKIEELEGKVQPLEARIAELESQKTFVEEEMKQLGEDRDRWQKRTEGILTKYGRVDPAEMEQMKQTVADLEAERDALKQAEEPLKVKIQELETTIENDRAQWKATREKIVEQAKERSRQQSARISEMTAQKATIQEQLDAVTQQFTTCQAELAQVTQEKAALEEKANNLEQQLASAPSSSEVIPVQPTADSSDRVAELEKTLEDIRQQLTSMSELKSAADQEVANLRTELATAIEARDKALEQLQNAPAQNGDAVMQNGVDNPEPSAPAQASSDADRVALEEKLAAAEAKVAELEEQIDARVKELTAQRSSGMREQLNNKLREAKTKFEKDLEEAKKAANAELDLRLQQERAIWAAEQNVSTPTPGATVSTPAKQEAADPPQTPTTGSTSVLIADFAKLNDNEVREVLQKNGTLKTIFSNNLRKKLTEETKKLRDEVEQTVKTEWETKVSSAKEQATMMESKKSSLRINMAENKLKNATAKLNIVETAAKDTPQRPVGEVWAVAKDAKAPPPQPAPAVSQSTASPAAPSNTTTLPPAGAGLPQPVKPAQAPTSTPVGTASPSANLPANPFQNATAASQPPLNPFAGAQTTPQSQPQAQTQTQPQPQTNAPPRTGIPVPANRGGAQARGGRAGVYQHPRGGRGGGQGQGQRNASGNLNPSAENFNPGNKRPRDSEAGTAGPGGAKRQRGGGGPRGG